MPEGNCGLTGICGEAENLGVVGMAGLVGADCAHRTGGAERVLLGDTLAEWG